jgi:ketosteroid isomerase-like protein
MMAEQHPNILRYRNALQAFNDNELDTAKGAFSKDMVYQFPGRSPIAGEYRGIEQFFKVLHLMKDMTTGTLMIEPQTVMANDEAVIVYARVTAQREGKTLDLDQVNLYRFNEDGIIFEGRIIPVDLYAFDEFWS